MTLRRVGLVVATALALAAPASPGTAWAGPGASASACTLAPTNGTVTRFVGGRSYTIRVPSGLTGPSVPLLLSLHGGGGFSAEQEMVSGWSTFAAQHNFIVAYPQAIANKWVLEQGSRDVAWLRQVADDISSRWCVDPRRIHADGHSDGAVMSQRLACDAADKFASVAPYAGATPTYTGTPCNPSRPIGVALFHGDSDMAAPIFLAEAGRDLFVDHDNCSPTPTSTTDSEGTLDRYTGCDNGVEVWWRVYRNQSHDWPTGARGEDMRSRIWSFFEAHPLP